VAQAFLSQELQREQAEQRRISGNHLRSGIAGTANQRVESQLGQQREEQEDSRRSCSDPQRFLTGQHQNLSIRDDRFRGLLWLRREMSDTDVAKKGDSVAA